MGKYYDLIEKLIKEKEEQIGRKVTEEEMSQIKEEAMDKLWIDASEKASKEA